MYSDTGSSFIAAPTTIIQKTGITIKRKFIPKGAPWQGGFWERMIGITKTTLKKVVEKALINEIILRIILSEV